MRKKLALSGKERTILNILHLPTNIFKYFIIQERLSEACSEKHCWAPISINSNANKR